MIMTVPGYSLNRFIRIEYHINQRNFIIFKEEFSFGLNIFYFKITMIIQTHMTYTQKIGLEWEA